MIFFYRLAFPFLALLAAPYFIYRMLRRGGYSYKFCYRLGLFPTLPPKKANCKRLWIQAVSVGELSSLSKIIDQLQNNKGIEIVLTGTTSTGLLMASQRYKNCLLAHGPFPLDWWPVSRLAWAKIQPDLILTVDSELWPEHFHQASLRGIPALVINARLSDRTFNRLQTSPIARNLLLPNGLEILTTSERQRSRWIEIGIPHDRVEVVGNLKVDAVTSPQFDQSESAKLKAEFGFNEDSFVLTGISTWQGEEEMLVDTLLEMRDLNLDARLLLVPRHAERRRQVIAMLQQKNIPYHQRTQKKQAPACTLVYLADTTGELSKLIECADLAFGGKTLPPNRGGQNPIEPIALGIPLVLGPNFQNFQQTCGDLLIHEAIQTTESKESAQKELLSLAQNSQRRNELRQNAISWFESQGSPTDRTLEKLFQLL